MSLTSSPEYKELKAHFETEAKGWHMRSLFQEDSGRFDKFK